MSVRGAPDPLKFRNYQLSDRSDIVQHLGSTAAEANTKVQSDAKIVIQNLSASRDHAMSDTTTTQTPYAEHWIRCMVSATLNMLVHTQYRSCTRHLFIVPLRTVTLNLLSQAPMAYNSIVHNTIDDHYYFNRYITVTRVSQVSFKPIRIAILLAFWGITHFIKVRADSRPAPSQWETALQSNPVSRWLGANLESFLKIMYSSLISTHCENGVRTHFAQTSNKINLWHAKFDIRPNRLCEVSYILGAQTSVSGPFSSLSYGYVAWNQLLTLSFWHLQSCSQVSVIHLKIGFPYMKSTITVTS